MQRASPLLRELARAMCVYFPPIDGEAYSWLLDSLASPQTKAHQP